MHSIGAGVKQGEVFVRERQRGDGREVVEQPRNFDEVAEAALGGGVLGVLARFDRQPRREERRGVAGVVPEIEFVKIPAGRAMRSFRVGFRSPPGSFVRRAPQS
jgi:hypothetical protein